MALTSSNNTQPYTISIDHNTMKPIGVKNGEAAIVTFEDMFQQAEDLELRLQAMTEHMEELTEEFGYKPSMTMEERIEAKRFLKKLSGK